MFAFALAAANRDRRARAGAAVGSGMESYGIRSMEAR